MSDPVLAAVIAIGIVALFIGGLFGRRLVAQPEQTTMASVGERLRAMEAKLETNERKVEQMTQRIEGLPTKETVHAMELKLAELQGEFRGVIASQNATAHAVQRVETFLMQATAERIAGAKSDNGAGI